MQMISDPSVLHQELDPLDPSSHYIFKVIARTAAGDGPPIEGRGATLLEGGDITAACLQRYPHDLSFIHNSVPHLGFTSVLHNLFPSLCLPSSSIQHHH